MESIIPSGSYILGMRLHDPLEKGDIIFNHDDKVLVKRIFAVHGESVEVTDGSEASAPGGCYYVLGDNSDTSIGSRYWENPFVSEVDIIATLLLPQ